MHALRAPLICCFKRQGKQGMFKKALPFMMLMTTIEDIPPHLLLILQQCACNSNVTVWFTLDRLGFWLQTRIGQQPTLHIVNWLPLHAQPVTAVPAFERVAEECCRHNNVDKAYYVTCNTEQ